MSEAETVLGSCHCQQIQIELKGEADFQFFCHCHDCRKLNGGGHLAGLSFKKEYVEIIAGKPHTYSYTGGSGKLIHLHFCANCATHMYAEPQEYAGIYVVRANILENDQVFKPQKSIYAHRAHEWSLKLT